MGSVPGSARKNLVVQIIMAVCRFGLAFIWLYSGYTKITDTLGTRQSIAAYELFSPTMINLIGAALPAFELALGVLLLLGVVLRVAGALSALVFIGFIAGIASAWARGLSIDCGCFGTGGKNPSVTGLTYMKEILRDLFFVAMAVVVAVKPFTKMALGTKR